MRSSFWGKEWLGLRHDLVIECQENQADSSQASCSIKRIDRVGMHWNVPVVFNRSSVRSWKTVLHFWEVPDLSRCTAWSDPAVLQRAGTRWICGTRAHPAACEKPQCKSISYWRKKRKNRTCFSWKASFAFVLFFLWYFGLFSCILVAVLWKPCGAARHPECLSLCVPLGASRARRYTLCHLNKRERVVSLL